MKKIKIIVSYLFFIILIPISVYAATINLNLITNSQNYEITEENKPLIVAIQLGDFINISDNIPLTYMATIEYDKAIFEEVTVAEKNGWNTSYNSLTNTIEGNTQKAIANTEVAEMIFKLKTENVKQTEATVIRLKDILISDGNFEINTEKEININITKQRSEQEIQEVQQIKDVTAILGEKSSSMTALMQIEKLPKAGMQRNITFILGIAIVLMIILKIKSREIKY